MAEPTPTLLEEIRQSVEFACQIHHESACSDHGAIAHTAWRDLIEAGIEVDLEVVLEFVRAVDP